MKHSVFTVLLPDMNPEEVFGLLSELSYDGVELRIKEDYHVPPDEILSRVKELNELKCIDSKFQFWGPTFLYQSGRLSSRSLRQQKS